jgi:hypothetical protein
MCFRKKQFCLKPTGNTPAKDYAKHRYHRSSFQLLLSEVDPFKRRCSETAQEDFGIDVLFIPGGLTSQVQPLDVFFTK